MFSIAYFTDFACEIYAKSRKSIPQGVQVETVQKNDVTITKVNISKSGLNREKGKYITLDIPNLATKGAESQEHICLIAEELANLIPQNGTVLVVGVGNNDITADKLGPETAHRIIATRALKQAHTLNLRKICTMVPGVEGASGIATQDAVLAISQKLNPCAIICVDSLLTSEAGRLGTSVQISTAGLSPKTARELSHKTIGVPVVAVGIPTMMQIKHAQNENELVVTPKNIDIVIHSCAQLLSMAINKALLPQLTITELEFIVS